MPPDASPFISYMRSIRELHYLCTQGTLGDYQLILFDFKTNFDFLYMEYGLPMTLKIHVIYHHYQHYFDTTQESMRFTNGEFTETAHATFKVSERTHGFRVNRMLGTPSHKEKALKSLMYHNVLKAGFTPPGKFTFRKSTPRIMSPL